MASSASRRPCPASGGSVCGALEPAALGQPAADDARPARARRGRSRSIHRQPPTPVSASGRDPHAHAGTERARHRDEAERVRARPTGDLLGGDDRDEHAERARGSDRHDLREGQPRRASERSTRDPRTRTRPLAHSTMNRRRPSLSASTPAASAIERADRARWRGRCLVRRATRRTRSPRRSPSGSAACRRSRRSTRAGRAARAPSRPARQADRAAPTTVASRRRSGPRRSAAR